MAGVIGGILTIIILLLSFTMQGAGAYISFYINTLLIYLVIQIILAAIGGALGSAIKAESLIKRSEEDLDK